MNHKISDEERTTPIGVFNYAQSYYKAASHLAKAKLRTTHPEAVVQFLFYHAMELYLKSFLMTQGHSSETLRKKFGHNLSKLSRTAGKLGLHFDEEDLGVFALTETSDAIMGSRYIKTGFFTLPAIEALDRTCKSLRQSVGAILKQRGEPVRL